MHGQAETNMLPLLQSWGHKKQTHTHKNKNSAEVDIAPAFGEIITSCNVGQAKKGHGACLKSGQLVYARFHTHSHRCCREMYFNSRLDIKFGQSEWSMKCRSWANGHGV